MKFFKPASIFFILKGIYGENYPSAVKWLNSLSKFSNFNSDESSVFVAGEMITFGKSLDFLREKKFIDLANQIFINKNSDINNMNSNRALIWRRYILTWAGEHCKNLKGDFCDFGCYDGLASKFINEYCGLKERNINFYLYDVFDQPPGSKKFPRHSEKLFDEVINSFEDSKNVFVVKGILPKSLIDNCPDVISFAHIDLNNADAEMGVLEIIYDKVIKGGIIIFDDYGWIGYKDQMSREKEFAESRGVKILELPTGQGLLIKN